MKDILRIEDKAIELKAFDEKILYITTPSLDEYENAVLCLNDNKFNIKILKSDIKKIKEIKGDS